MVWVLPLFFSSGPEDRYNKDQDLCEWCKIVRPVTSAKEPDSGEPGQKKHKNRFIF
jgi:hypothetical protein